jgi:hypothetical protein
MLSFDGGPKIEGWSGLAGDGGSVIRDIKPGFDIQAFAVAVFAVFTLGWVAGLFIPNPLPFGRKGSGSGALLYALD